MEELARSCTDILRLAPSVACHACYQRQVEERAELPYLHEGLQEAAEAPSFAASTHVPCRESMTYMRIAAAASVYLDVGYGRVS